MAKIAKPVNTTTTKKSTKKKLISMLPATEAEILREGGQEAWNRFNVMRESGEIRFSRKGNSPALWAEAKQKPERSKNQSKAKPARKQKQKWTLSEQLEDSAYQDYLKYHDSASSTLRRSARTKNLFSKAVDLYGRSSAAAHEETGHRMAMQALTESGARIYSRG